MMMGLLVNNFIGDEQRWFYQIAEILSAVYAQGKDGILPYELQALTVTLLPLALIGIVILVKRF